MNKRHKSRSSKNTVKERFDKSHGSFRAGMYQPDNSLKIMLSFEEAAMLNIALQAALLSINRIDKRTMAGKNRTVYIQSHKYAKGDTEATFNVWDGHAKEVRNDIVY